MRARIVCLPGDGTGPEVMQEAVRVLTSVACAFDHSFSFVDEKLVKPAYTANGPAVSEKILDSCRAANAMLLGSGDLLIPGAPTDSGIKSSLIALASQLDLGVHVQITTLARSAADKDEANTDAVLVWPASYAIYDGYIDEESQIAHEIVSLSASQAEQAMQTAFKWAHERRRTLHAVMEPGFFASTKLFREAAQHIATAYSTVPLVWLEASHCANELVRNPEQFDVLLTCAPYGGIFSGILAGKSPSPALTCHIMAGSQGPDIYSPAYGDDPALSGRDMVSPISMILAAAHMLTHALQLDNEANCVEMAVSNVLNAGWRTADMAKIGEPKVGTQAIGKLIAEQVDMVGAVMGGFRR